MNRLFAYCSFLAWPWPAFIQRAKPGHFPRGKPSAGASAASSSLPSEATFNAFLKKMFGWDPNLTWKIIEIKPSEAAGISQLTAIFNTPQGQQVMRLYVTQDQKFAFTGELIPFGADPFADTREELKGANGPSHGPKDATLTIVEFGDLQCPACKQAQPNINKLMEEEPKARLIFQNFPLETLHKWAMTGAKYVDCLGRRIMTSPCGNSLTWYMTTRPRLRRRTSHQMLKGYVKEAGGDPDAVAACVAKPETEKRVRESMALGEKVGVTSTPTFYINGRRLAGFGKQCSLRLVKQMADFYVSNAGNSRADRGSTPIGRRPDSSGSSSLIPALSRLRVRCGEHATVDSPARLWLGFYRFPAPISTARGRRSDPSDNPQGILVVPVHVASTPDKSITNETRFTC